MISLSKIVKEGEEPKKFSNEVKKHFLEIVSTYNKYQEMMDRKSDIAEIAEVLGGITEAARELAVNESDNWFDAQTVKRNMSELAKLGGQFDKVAIEAKNLDQRLHGLYEDMGHILSRYYKIGEISEDQMKERLGLREMDNPCWKGYEMVGTKTKDGKEVPNCVPKNESIKESTDCGCNSVNEAFQKGKTYGGTKCEGGCYIGKQGLIKIIKISKESPNDVFMFRDDNYSGLQPHFVKDGIIAKATTLNPSYDLDKNKVRNLKIGNDVILSVRLFVSTNESVNESSDFIYYDAKQVGPEIKKVLGNLLKSVEPYSNSKSDTGHIKFNFIDNTAKDKFLSKEKSYVKSIETALSRKFKKNILLAGITRGNSMLSFSITSDINESVNEAEYGYKDSTASYITKHKDEFKTAEKMNKGNEQSFYDSLSALEEKLGHPKYMIFLSNALRGYKVDMYKDPKIKNQQEAEEALFLLSK